MSTYIIADVGANHDGQYARMLEAIDEAKHAGCDCAIVGSALIKTPTLRLRDFCVRINRVRIIR